MIFDTPEYRLLVKHYPLRLQEIASLQRSIRQSAEVAHALIMWGVAMDRFVKLNNVLPVRMQEARAIMQKFAEEDMSEI